MTKLGLGKVRALFPIIPSYQKRLCQLLLTQPHFVNLVFARTIMSGVIHSLLVQYGKSSYLNSVVQQCLTYAYRNRIQGTMCSECSIRLMC